MIAQFFGHPNAQIETVQMYDLYDLREAGRWKIMSQQWKDNTSVIKSQIGLTL